MHPFILSLVSFITYPIVKGSEVDDLFVNATLPSGWRKIATDHSMHSNLIDDRGLVRAGIFYKAAFYDRSAFITVNKSRFEIRKDYKDRNKVAFNVCDKGLNLVVKYCEGAQYALHQDILGCYLKGVFYHEIKGQELQSFFTDDGIVTNDVTILSLDSFFKDYHHKMPRHDLIKATEKLAKTEAQEFYESLPSDDSQWSSEYDFQAQ